MSVRDMDIAAESMGVSLLKTKLQAFAISSFYCGVAGALFAFTYLKSLEPVAFDIKLSFKVLFMVILGGLGTINGAFIGAALKEQQQNLENETKLIENERKIFELKIKEEFDVRQSFLLLMLHN